MRCMMNGKQHLLALTLLALSACSAEAERPPLSGAPIGGEFELVDARGDRFGSEQLKGGPHLVYFGYTYCPDVCPVDVARLGRAYALIEERNPQLARRLTPVFVSIDPARDTPEIVGEFTGNFHPAIIGLTGTQQAVGKAVSAYRVYAARADGVTSGAEDSGYLMDHTTNIYLMDADGSPVNYYDRSVGHEEMATDILRWVG